MAPEAAVLAAAATAALRRGRHDEACDLLAQAVQADDANTDLLQMAAVLHCLQGRHLQALPWLRRAHEQAPERKDILGNLARAAYRCGMLNEAWSCHEQLEERGAAGLAERLDRIAILAALSESEQALALACKTVHQAPGCAAAWLAWGNALDGAGLREAALYALDHALALDPSLCAAWVGRGGVLHRLQRFDEAMVCHQAALAQDPGNGLAWSNQASTLMRLERFEEALESCNQALALLNEPSAQELEQAQACPDSLTWLGVQICQAELYSASYRKAEAAQAYARLAALLPKNGGMKSILLFARRGLADWHEDETLLAESRASVVRDDAVHAPFVVMGTVDDPALQKLAIAKVGGQIECPAQTAPALGPGVAGLAAGGSAGRIRLAYVSADYHHHATAYLMNRFFAMHDRSRFEVLGVSLAKRPTDDMTERLRPQFDDFIEVGRMPDAGLVDLLRGRQIDIAIDLKGYTRDSRPELFAARIAPLQISWLGFPATTGIPEMDVVLADRHTIPASDFPHYTEQVAWVDGCYQCNDDERRIASPAPSRIDLGLPAGAFVFCCHNATWKINPPVFERWMQILRAVPGSVLWLLGDYGPTIDNLKREAQARGVAPERLLFSAMTPHEQHLARLSRADLFLDTLPYNAHTTGSDALWAGLPVLTCTGSTFAGRVGTSLLHAVGLPELVCSSMDEYVSRAVALATRERPLLHALRRRLKKNRKGSVLFNTANSCRDVERVYLRLLQERGMLQAGLALAA